MRRHLRAWGFVVAIGAIPASVAHLAVFFTVNAYSRLVHAPDFAEAFRRVNHFMESNYIALSSLSRVLALALLWAYFALRKTNLWAHCRTKVPSFSSMAAAVPLGAGIFLSWVGAFYLLGLGQFLPVHPFYYDAISRYFESVNWLTLLSLSLITPLFEEVTLRGIIFNRLRLDYSPVAALVLQALFFGILHVDPGTVIYASLSGIVLGLTYLWLGSIWIPVVIHGAQNLSSLIFWMTASHFGIAPGSGTYVGILAVGLLLLIYSLRYLRGERVAISDITQQQNLSAWDGLPI